MSRKSPSPKSERETARRTPAPGGNRKTGEAASGADGARQRRQRDNSKQAQLIAMLRRPNGATIEEIVAAFGWQPHTARGAIAGALKKRLGLAVASDKVEGRGRVYRIAD